MILEFVNNLEELYPISFDSHSRKQDTTLEIDHWKSLVWLLYEQILVFFDKGGDKSLQANTIVGIFPIGLLTTMEK